MTGADLSGLFLRVRMSYIPTALSPLPLSGFPLVREILEFKGYSRLFEGKPVGGGWRVGMGAVLGTAMIEFSFMLSRLPGWEQPTLRWRFRV